VQHFLWARKKLLPTNERRLRHHISPTAAFRSCSQYEDTDHLLLLCPQEREVLSFFYPDFDAQAPSNLTDLWTS
jgi:hypothetical protein